MIFTAERIREIVADILLSQEDLLQITVRPFGDVSHSADGQKYFVELSAEVSYSSVLAYISSKIPVDSLENQG